MIATITLNPSIDQHILVKNLVKDDANRALSISNYPGGKGVNVSKVIQELKGPTKAYAMLGGFVGEIWKELASAEKIAFDACRLKGQTRINTILTDIKDHTQTRVSAPGPTMNSTERKHFLSHLVQVKPKPFLWALGGSLPKQAASDSYKKIIQVLQRNGTPCILDADNEALKKGIEAKPFMIKPNEFEMQRLLNKKLESFSDYYKGAKELVRQGIQIVVVSLGPRGALFVTECESFHVTTPKVKVRSKVGAGDSLIGGFVLGLWRKMPLREAARLGVAASTSAVLTEGTRLCRREDIPKLLPRIHAKSI